MNFKNMKTIFFLFPPTGPNFCSNLKLFLLDNHCQCCSSLLTKSDIKPMYQSQDNRALQNLQISTRGTNLENMVKFSSSLMTLDPGEILVKFVPVHQTVCEILRLKGFQKMDDLTLKMQVKVNLSYTIFLRKISQIKLQKNIGDFHKNQNK